MGTQKEGMVKLKLTAHQKRIAHDFSDYFTNSGGNDVAELIERKGVNMVNNGIVALMQVSCEAQLWLLERLLKEGKLEWTIKTNS